MYKVIEKEGISLEHILIIEDEKNIVELIKYNLEKLNYKVSVAYDGEDGLNKINRLRPDLIILDLMLPKIDGNSICIKLKNSKSFSNIPIIILTAKSAEIDRVLGLELGADDYVVKPFSIKELMVRVKNIIKRYKKNSNFKEEEIITLGGLIIDPSKHEVTLDGEKVFFTLKEFELLKILAKNKGKVLSRSSLLENIWGYEYLGETRTVDVHIRHIRSKIEKNRSYIETIRGVGYKCIS